MKYDVVIIGAGMAGVCAALAASRNGCRTLLVQDRPIPGGNAGSEIGVKIQGADELGHYRYARETGLLNEIFERNSTFPNPFQSPSVLSLVLWEMLRTEPLLTVKYNCRASNPCMNGKHLQTVTLRQDTTEKEMIVQGDIFIDCSGDGGIAAAAGVPFMLGREDKKRFGETLASEQTDCFTMGSTIYFKIRDAGRPIPFQPPAWVPRFYSDNDLPGALSDCPHSLSALTGSSGGYWWIEYGGEMDPLADAEVVRDKLFGYVMGVWDHIKNHGDHGADNYVLESIGCVPGRRESRRLLGEYVLTQKDVENCRIFTDAIAYGGWHIDLHNPKGIAAAPERYWHGRLLPGRYTIPFRCLFSTKIPNLMFAGRNISASHVALGSTRVMATCALIGQAAGTAAALCKKYGCDVPQISAEHIEELQQQLLSGDCYLPGFIRKIINKPDHIFADSSLLLQLPPGETLYEIPEMAAQSFITGDIVPERAVLTVVNRNSAPVELTLQLYQSQSVDDFRTEHLLQESVQMIQPGENSLNFNWGYNALKTNQSYFIAIKTTRENIFWPYTSTEFPGTQAGKLEGQVFEPEIRFIRRIRGSFDMRLEPLFSPFTPKQIFSGVNRTENSANVWIPGADLPQSVIFTWDTPIFAESMEIIFDNCLDWTWAQWCAEIIPSGLVKQFKVVSIYEGKESLLAVIADNRNRVVKFKFAPQELKTVKITIESIHGTGRPGIVSLVVG